MVVVGFMKEKYEYLIDDYNVELIVNPEIFIKNNLHSMRLVLLTVFQTLILFRVIFGATNPFSPNELYSWYMKALVDNDSTVRVNRKMELVSVPTPAGGNAMIGISYLIEEQAALVREGIATFCEDLEMTEHLGGSIVC